MKQLDNYITERLKLTSKTKSNTYTCQPKSFGELRDILEDRLMGKDKNADLNDIDVSNITDLGGNAHPNGLFERLDPHNIKIDQWDVSNVINMEDMFFGCKNLECDISKWDVSKVTNMQSMFVRCENFNCDLSNWNVSNVEDMYYMFYKCNKFNSDISGWNVSNVIDMNHMFAGCENFDCNLDNWDTSNVEAMSSMFRNCPNLKAFPKWYQP